MKNHMHLFLALLLALSFSLMACSLENDETGSADNRTDTPAPDEDTTDTADMPSPSPATDVDATITSGDPNPTMSVSDTSIAATPVDAANDPQSIRMARANWDTGWFQAEIYRQLLEELGYDVEVVESLSPNDFYPALAQGDYDLWVNGWFPLHDGFLRDFEIRRYVQQVGAQVPGGALQGYLIDKRTADEFNITSINDLKNSDVVAAFDRDGNGQADLIGCNEGWGCERVIEHHLDAYELRDTVQHVQGEYSDLMRDTVDAYEAGESILFYTWTPNWPLDKLEPGEDVIWLQVPFSTLPDSAFTSEDATSVGDLDGCAADPCNVGYPPNDIRVVANTAFIHEHADVEQLLQEITIPLGAINEQNRRLVEGEDSPRDIREQAEDWIANNRTQVNEWLETALNTPEPTAGDSLLWQVQERGSLRCGIGDDELLGFNEQRNDGSYSGFDIDFCRVIAVALFNDPEAVDFIPLSDAERFRAVENGDVDVVIRDISWTALRDLGMDSPNAGTRLDFGPVILHDGQGFMVRTDSQIQSMEDLAGQSICVLAESDAAKNLTEQFETRDITFSLVDLSTTGDVYTAYENGGCDAVTANASQLAAQRSEFTNPDQHLILGNRISREQFAPSFIEGDPLWRDLVSWSIYATIYAEELEQARQEELGPDAEFELDAETAEQLRSASANTTPEMQRLLGVEGDIGERLGVSNDFAFNIIREVGHYGNIYERNLGQLEIEQRGPNAPWNVGSGGLLYTPPFR